MSAATQALGRTTGDATRAARTAVVKRGARGGVVDTSKLSKLNQDVLDDPFAALDRSYSDALASAGLSEGPVTTGAVDAQ